MPTGYTSVSAANLCDATGTKIANATIYFQPCNNNGVKLSFRAGGAGGQVVDQPVSATVASGVFTVQLADTTLTEPVNVGYLVTCVDNVTGNQLLGAGYIIQPSGSSWSFDSFIPNVGALATLQTGPAGQGFNSRGAWEPNTTYEPYDVYQEAGSSYLVTTTYASGSSYGSVDTENTTLFAASGQLSGTLSTPLVAPLGATITEGLTADTLSIGSVTDSDIPPNLGGYVDAIADSTDAIAVGITADGVLHANAGIVANGGTLTNPTLVNASSASLEIGAELETPMPTTSLANRYGLVDGSVDASGNICEGIFPTGEKWLPAGIRGWSQGGPPCRDTDGMSYYSQLTSGNWQIFRKDDLGNVLQLTSGLYNNICPQVSADGGLILFLSDRGGTAMQPYQMDRGGCYQLPLGTDTTQLVTLNHGVETGQSLAGGYDESAITTSQPLDNLMLNGGPRCGSAAGIAVAASNMTSLVPLIEVNGATVSGISDDANYGETMSSTIANQLAQKALTAGIRFRMAMTVNAEGNTPYSGIKKGTVPYSNGLAEVTAVHSLAAAASMSHAVRFGTLIHGESDEKDGTPNYYQDVPTLAQNYNADYAAITGQSFTFPWFFCQESSWTKYVPAAIGIIAFQQLQAAQANLGQLYLVGPKYFLSYVDGVHITAASQQWWGEYYARAIWQVLFEGQLWRPVYPRKITRFGNQIYIRFWVWPGNSLVIDTTNVAAPTANPSGLNGFEYFDNSGTPPAITNVALVGTDAVLITLASTPTGTGNRIRYAYTGTSGNAAGPTTGARGNLRDNSNDTSAYGHPNMYNWCCHFDEAC